MFGHSRSASQPPSWPLSPIAFTYQGFTGLLLTKYNQPKQKTIQFLKTMCGLGRVFEVTTSSQEGCLNTLRLFSLGGELHLSFFLFLSEKIATNPKTFFNGLRITKVFTPIKDRQIVFLERQASRKRQMKVGQIPRNTVAKLTAQKHLQKLPIKSGKNTS